MAEPKTVEFDRAASPKVWAELDALRATLREARAAIDYAARGADVVTSNKLAITLARIDAALAGEPA